MASPQDAQQSPTSTLSDLSLLLSSAAPLASQCSSLELTVAARAHHLLRAHQALRLLDVKRRLSLQAQAEALCSASSALVAGPGRPDAQNGEPSAPAAASVASRASALLQPAARRGRTKLAQDTQAFSEHVAASLHDFERMWDQSMAGASAWHAERRSTGKARQLDQQGQEEERPRLSWLSDVRKGTLEEGKSVVELLLRTLKRMLNRPGALATALMELEARAISELMEKLPASKGEPAVREETPLRVMLDFYETASGAPGVLAFTEALLVAATQRLERSQEREVEALILALLSDLHATGLTVQIEIQEGSQAAAADPLAPSRSLELALLSYLRHSAPSAPPPPRAAPSRIVSTPQTPTTEAAYTRSRRVSSPGTPAAVLGGTITALGTGAADLWNASLAGGRGGLSTLSEGVSTITAGMSGLFASGASESTGQSPPSREKTLTPTALHTPRKAPSSLSVSNFSTPTLSSTGSSASSSTTTTPRLFPRSGLPDLAEDGAAPIGAFAATDGADARKKLGSLVEGLPPRRRTVSDANSAAKVGAPTASTLGMGHPSASCEAPGHAGPPVEAVCEVFRALSGASSSERITAQTQMQTMPLVQYLSRRLLQHHFSASASPASHRRLTLLILVRWYAFHHLRSLLTKPDASRSLPATPHLRLSRGAAQAPAAAQNEQQKMMEGVWTAGDEAQQRLGELHRAVYAAMLRATGMSKAMPKGPSAGADAEARRLVESFGAHVAGGKGAAHMDRCAEASEGIAVLGLRAETAAALLRHAGSLLLCERIAASPQLPQSATPSPSPSPLRIDTSSSPNPAGAQPLASSQEVEAAALDLLAGGEAQATREATQEPASASLESLAVLYVSTRSGGRYVLDRTLAGLEKQLGPSSAAFSQRLVRTANAGPETAKPSGGGSGIPFPRLVASAGGGAITASGASPTSVGMTQSLTSSTISSSLGRAGGASSHPSNESGWGSPPQSPSMRDTFANELDGLPGFSPDLPMRRSSRRGGPPSAWKGGVDEPEPSVPMLIEADNDEEMHWDEIRRGVLTLLRKGYISTATDAGKVALLSSLANGAAQASERHAFDDAAMFTQTHALLSRLLVISPSMAYSAPSSFGSRTHSSSSTPTFAPLLARLAAPLRAAEAATMARIAAAHARLAELEVQRCALIDRARIVYSVIQELRTRVWYACEIRVAPAVVEAREKASAGLLDAQATTTVPGESGQEWLKRLAIYDFAVPARIQDYLRDLDGAFGAIAGDTAAFFASPVWVREAQLARPFLEGSADDVEGDAAVLTFGACTTELLQPNEVRSPTRVGLEDFLQRVQLLATGLLLSEAMAGVTAPTPEPPATSEPHPHAELVKELKEAGARNLLARFELHPAPRTKMRALLVLEKLIVSLLSRNEHARPVAYSAATTTDAGITTPKAASPPRPVATAATRTGYTSLRRPTPARPTIVRRASDHRSAHAASASANASIDERRQPKAPVLAASPRIPSKARRALSMYDDDSGDESGQEGADGLDGLPSANGPSIHDLLASMLSSPSTSKSSPTEGDAVTLRSESPTRGSNAAYARRPSSSKDAGARKATRPAPNAAPTTDDVVGVLEALCADASCRPRDLFLHLQIVAAFTPTSVLDFKDEAYCFWNWGAACLAALPPAPASDEAFQS